MSKYLDIFIKNKASLQKHSELILPFIEAVDKFRNVCLVDYLIAVFLSAVCRKLSITCKLRTVLTLLLLTVDSMQSIIYCRQIAHFLCVCLSHRGRLICVN